MILVIIKHLKNYLETLITKKMTADDAEHIQDEFNSILGVLSNYTPIEAKNKLLDNAKNFYKGREKIIEGFKNGIFPLKYEDAFEEQARYKEEEEKKSETKIVSLIIESL